MRSYSRGWESIFLLTSSICPSTPTFVNPQQINNLLWIPRVWQIFGDTDYDSEPETAIKRRCHNVLPCPVPPIPSPTPDNEACQTTARPLLDQRQTESYFTAAPPAPLSTSCMPSSQCLKLQHVSLTHHQALWARSLPRLCQMSISLGPHLDWGRQALDQFHALLLSCTS